MERAAAGTSLRRERRLVAPREGVITAPGLIPAEVPGVTFPSSRAVVSVASGEEGRRAGGGGAAALLAPGRAAGAARCALCAGRRPSSPHPRVAPLGVSAFSPQTTPHPPPSHAGSPSRGPPGSHHPAFSAPGPRLSHPGLPLPGAQGRPQSRRRVNATSKQKSGRFKRAFETR